MTERSHRKPMKWKKVAGIKKDQKGVDNNEAIEYTKKAASEGAAKNANPEGKAEHIENF